MPHRQRSQSRPAATDPKSETELMPAMPARAERVTWRCEEPGRAAAFLTDPVWPTDAEIQASGFRRPQRAAPARRSNGLRALQALVAQDERARRRDRRGRALDAARESRRHRSIRRRNGPPTSRSAPAAQINLFYIARQPAARGWKVHSVPLEIDHETGEPHLQRNNGARTLLER